MARTTATTPISMDDMREATRLTRAGQLHDATALIQRSLRPGSGTAQSPTPSPAADAHSQSRRPSRAVTHDDQAPQRPTGLDRTRIGRLRPVDAATPKRPPAGPGTFQAHTVTAAGGTRRYWLYVPADRVGTALPLVVMLHGCTQDAGDFSTGTRMNALAEHHGFVVAYPEQDQSANPSRCWNWFRAADQRRGQGEPSIIAAVVDQVAARHPIDRRRVYVAGMSAGAAMALVMASAYPDVFAAVGAHSGLAVGVASDLPSALQAMRQGPPATTGATGLGNVPAIVFHGDKDTTVHRTNGEQILRQATADLIDPMVVVRERTAGGRGCTQYTYRTVDGRVWAEGWSVQGLGHAWSGGDGAGSHTDAAGPDASAEMIRFFAEHRLR